MAAIIENQLMVDYLKIMLNLLNSFKFEAGFRVEQEESLRERVRSIIYGMSGDEMLDLAKQVIENARTILIGNKNFNLLIVYLLEDTVGLRLSKKYISATKITDPSTVAVQVDFTPAQEKELIQILTPFIPEDPGEVYKLKSLIYSLTGE